MPVRTAGKRIDRERILSPADCVRTVAMTPQKKQVLDLLRRISGKHTIAGIHNREPNSEPLKQTREIERRTGKTPGLWSGDFLFSAHDVATRWSMVHEARRQWEAGSLVNIMAHVAPPTQPDVCQWEGGLISKLSDSQWKDLTSPRGALNRAWLARLDNLATYLRYLRANDVPVLFRPLHEMNQGQFWWGGRPGPEGTAKLFRITHDHLTNRHGLDNLIWTWDLQDLSTDLADYNPGSRYWDILAFDIYDKGWDPVWYQRFVRLSGGKPIAVGECDKLPTPEILSAQPRWCFFMSWAELTFEKNDDDAIRRLYSDPRVLTRERLWNGKRPES